MRKLRKLLALDGAQRRVLVASLVLLPVVAVLLRVRGLAAARAFVAALPVPRYAELSPADAARLIGAAAAITGASCLPRSLVLWRLVRARGAAIRFGVARTPSGGIAAHAWVELAGVPLNDSAEVAVRYAALERGAGSLSA